MIIIDYTYTFITKTAEVEINMNFFESIVYKRSLGNSVNHRVESLEIITWNYCKPSSGICISQVVRDDVAPAELAHLHSEVVRYLGTSRNNRLSA